MELRVFYDDTDANGIVYHTNYIKYCDRARLEYFFENNISLIEDNSFLVIRNLDCKFYIPAKLGDILYVSSRIDKITSISVSVYHKITNANNEKIFSMNIQLVYTGNNKPKKLPNELTELFKKFRIEKEDR